MGCKLRNLLYVVLREHDVLFNLRHLQQTLVEAESNQNGSFARGEVAFSARAHNTPHITSLLRRHDVNPAKTSRISTQAEASHFSLSACHFDFEFGYERSSSHV